MCVYIYIYIEREREREREREGEREIDRYIYLISEALRHGRRVPPLHFLQDGVWSHSVGKECSLWRALQGEGFVGIGDGARLVVWSWR